MLESWQGRCGISLDFFEDILVEECCVKHEECLKCNVRHKKMKVLNVLFLLVICDIELSSQDQELTWNNYHPFQVHQKWMQKINKQFSNNTQVNQIIILNLRRTHYHKTFI